jgi:hypothetical protein
MEGIEKAKKLEELIRELVSLGEEERELSFWQMIFDDLREDEQDSIIAMLQEELLELRGRLR